MIIETDTAGSLDVGILNVQVFCIWIILGQMTVLNRRGMRCIPDDMLRI